MESILCLSAGELEGGVPVPTAALGGPDFPVASTLRKQAHDQESKPSLSLEPWSCGAKWT